MKKTISTILAATFIAGAMGAMPAMAEDNPIVYTYINEVGETVNVTQNELDAEHWDTAALGDTAPVVYKDFPVIMNPYVDDFANLSLEIEYLKETTDDDNVCVTITDMFTEQIIYTGDLCKGTLYTDNLEMDGYYQIKIIEKFSNEEEKEYVKYISTAYETAEMPDYVFNLTENDTADISIIDTANIALATTVDENGREVFDADIAALTNVPANEWIDYCESLEKDKLYRVVTGDGRNMKMGFISTYEWGEKLGVFNPEYTLYSEDITMIPQLCDFDPSTIPNSNVTGAMEYDSFGDLLFSSDSNHYRVIQYEIKAGEDFNGPENNRSYQYNVKINVSDSFSLLIWYKKADSSTVVKNYSVSTARKGNKAISMVAVDDEDEKLGVGDIMYFVIYSPTATNLTGSICIENIDYTDDVSGSAYYQYINDNSVVCAPYSPGYDEDEIKSEYGHTYLMTDQYDVDTFYINNTADNDSSYSLVFENPGVINEIGKQKGTTLLVTLYYVDFDDDSHFVLKKQSYTRINPVNEAKGYTGLGNLNFAPRNEYSKYFFEVAAISAGISNSEYNFWTMFYPES